MKLFLSAISGSWRH